MHSIAFGIPPKSRLGKTSRIPLFCVFCVFFDRRNVLALNHIKRHHLTDSGGLILPHRDVKDMCLHDAMYKAAFSVGKRSVRLTPFIGETTYFGIPTFDDARSTKLCSINTLINMALSMLPTRFSTAEH